MMKFVKLLILLILLTNQAQAKLFDAKEYELENGMKIIVSENHKAPILTSMIWYKVGSIDDFAGRTGLAHFNEHLMFKGTKKIKEGEFSKIIARNGGRDNAFTSYNYTAYHQTIAKDKLELLMYLEADRMQNIVLYNKAFEKEHKVIIEERLSRVENNPRALFSEKIRRLFYDKTPYSKPVIGYMEEIKSISKEDVLKFHKTWYAPNNAILVIAGDVKFKDVKKLAEKYFAKIKPKVLPKRKYAYVPPHNINARLQMSHELIKQPIFSRKYLAPSIILDKNNLTYAVDVLNEIFGEDITSRLYQELVVKQKIAVSAGSSYNGNNLGSGSFSIYASPSSNVSLKKLEEQIDKEIQHFLTTKITEKELEKAKRALTHGLIYLKDNNSTVAHILGTYASLGYDISKLEKIKEEINKVTIKDVMKAGKEIFNQNNFITGYLTPKKGN